MLFSSTRWGVRFVFPVFKSFNVLSKNGEKKSKNKCLFFNLLPSLLEVSSFKSFVQTARKNDGKKSTCMNEVNIFQVQVNTLCTRVPLHPVHSILLLSFKTGRVMNASHAAKARHLVQIGP